MFNHLTYFQPENNSQVFLSSESIYYTMKSQIYQFYNTAYTHFQHKTRIYLPYINYKEDINERGKEFNKVQIAQD